MDDYLRGTVDDSNEDFSPLAIRSKAGALYDRAIYIASQYRAGTSVRAAEIANTVPDPYTVNHADMPNRNEFFARFNALDTVIERFHRQLAAIRNRSPDDMREVLVCRTFACVAAIQLHSAFSGTQPTSWQKTLCVAIAAGRALDIVDISQARHIDPVMAVSTHLSDIDDAI